MDNRVAATGQSDMGCTAERKVVRTGICGRGNKGNSNSICNLPRLPPKRISLVILARGAGIGAGNELNELAFGCVISPLRTFAPTKDCTLSEIGLGRRY